MASANQAFDSLPYIDPEPTPQERERIAARLNADVPRTARTTLHPSLPGLIEPTFSALMTAELDRVARNEKLAAIDASRYESLDPPASTDDATAWRDVLRRAYAAQAYLTNRREHLALLDEHGRNAWLVGNYHLEHELTALEKELVATREAIETTNKARKGAQEGSSGELEALGQTWRQGVGRILEVEVAGEKLRQEALEARRKGAVG